MLTLKFKIKILWLLKQMTTLLQMNTLELLDHPGFLMGPIITVDT